MTKQTTSDRALNEKYLKLVGIDLDKATKLDSNAAHGTITTILSWDPGALAPVGPNVALPFKCIELFVNNAVAPDFTLTSNDVNHVTPSGVNDPKLITSLINGENIITFRCWAYYAWINESPLLKFELFGGTAICSLLTDGLQFAANIFSPPKPDIATAHPDWHTTYLDPISVDWVFSFDYSA